MKKLLFLVAALVAGVPATGAWAQDAPVEDEAAGTSAEAADDGGEDAIDDASATEAEKALERDLAMFWGKRRQVKVVQKRAVEKDGRFELTLNTAIIPNDDFIVYYPQGLRAGYHFSEAFEVELSGSLAVDVDSGLTEFLETEAGLRRADLQETVKFYYNVSLLWAPIYGKISFLGAKLAHFETFVGMGLGAFHTTEFPEGNPQGNDVIKPAANTVLGFRWFINDSFNIRTEYRHFFFEKFDGGVSMPVELSLGLGFMI
jgi:outer membrane beta-barrel protein